MGAQLHGFSAQSKCGVFTQGLKFSDSLSKYYSPDLAPCKWHQTEEKKPKKQKQSKQENNLKCFLLPSWTAWRVCVWEVTFQQCSSRPRCPLRSSTIMAVCPPANSCLVRSRSEWLSPFHLSWFYRPSSHPLQVAGVVWSWSFPSYLWWSFLLIEIFHFKCFVSVRAPVFLALTPSCEHLYLKYYVGSGATLPIHLH